ncbi:hypothetical protein Ahy_A02g006210 isoform D [Arachis hypogaea]|uniref:Sey1/RHD3-like three-helix bundle domain-containing protein n=1 Tax=Arachis hypogaea TaxID=3818 RepID=A0A445E9J4_ARAHY|nr:hypothetical protein Ahy_A02g006210 isoform D [Arachis hypogaea]
MSLPPPRASSASSLCWLLCRLCSAPFRSSASATTPSWKTVPLSVFDFLLLQCSVDLIIHALTQSLNLRLTLPSLLLAAVHTQGLTSVSSSSSRASLFRLSLPSSSQVSASDSCSFRLPLLMLLESGLLSASSYSGSLLPPSALPCSVALRVSHHKCLPRSVSFQSPTSALTPVLELWSEKTDNHTRVQELHQNEKPRSRNSCKRAKDMANLINYKPWSNQLLSSFTTLLSKTNVLQTLCHIKEPSKAFRFFKWAHEMGFPHSAQSYFMMLEILGRQRNLNVARNFLFSIEKKSNGEVKLEDRFFNSLIRSYGEAGLFKESIKLFETMKSTGVLPSVVTFNSVLSILLRRGRTNMARAVYDEMLGTYGVTPDVYTYNILIRGFCKNSYIEEGFRFFKEMMSFDCDPDVVTYNSLVDGLCKAGKVFENMKNLQVPADSASYSVLIRSLCQRGDYDAAEKLFDELYENETLLSNYGSKPIAASYSPIFQYLCEHGKTKKAEKVLRQLMKRGTQDPLSYKTVIMGHCKEGAYENGYGILVWMLRRDFVPDFEIYDCLIDGFLLKDKPLLAKETLEKMLKSSYKPKTSTLHSILARLLEKGCVHESTSLIVMMLERNIRQNINLSTENLLLLFGSGLRDKAFQIIELHYKNGYRVKIEVVQFLCQRGKLPEACKLLLFSMEHHRNIDIDLCNSVIAGLCKINKVSEAFNLCYELAEKGLHQELICLNDLIAALEAGGRLKEAAFISKRMPRVDLKHDDRQKQLAKGLIEPVESLFEAGGKDTWVSIRKLLKRETEAAVTELSACISGFELDEETVERMQQSLRDYAKQIVANKAKEESGKILIRMKDRMPEDNINIL